MKVVNLTQSYYDSYEMEISQVIKLGESGLLLVLEQNSVGELNPVLREYRRVRGVLRILAAGVEPGVQQGQRRFFMSHGGCRDGLELKLGSQYLIIGPKEDQWSIDSNTSQ